MTKQYTLVLSLSPSASCSPSCRGFRTAVENDAGFVGVGSHWFGGVAVMDKSL